MPTIQQCSLLSRPAAHQCACTTLEWNSAHHPEMLCLSSSSPMQQFRVARNTRMKEDSASGHHSESLIQCACTLTDPLRQRLYPPPSSARFYLVQQYSGSRCPVVSGRLRIHSLSLPFPLIFLRYLILQQCQAALSNEGYCLSPSICSSSDYELKTLPSAAILFFPPLLATSNAPTQAHNNNGYWPIQMGNIHRPQLCSQALHPGIQQCRARIVVNAIEPVVYSLSALMTAFRRYPVFYATSLASSSATAPVHYCRRPSRIFSPLRPSNAAPVASELDCRVLACLASALNQHVKLVKQHDHTAYNQIVNDWHLLLAINTIGRRFLPTPSISARQSRVQQCSADTRKWAPAAGQHDSKHVLRQSHVQQYSSSVD